MDELYIDTQGLRECLLDQAEQIRQCTELAAHLENAQILALPEDLPYILRFRELTEEIEKYLRAERDAFESICDIFDRTAQEISDIIDTSIKSIDTVP